MATPPEELRHAGWAAVSAAFGSLGRVCMALDAEFRVRHASERIDGLVGEGAHDSIVGVDAAEIFGDELFGRTGVLRRALEAGEKREGWRASLHMRGASRLVSMTVAPLQHDAYGVCDALASYLIVLRPAEDESGLEGAPTGFGGLIARSPAMVQIFRLIDNLQQSDATVLITGESGTGKEVVARAIHEHSARRDGPFVAINCGALPGELLESELFGHVRGAFTGAHRDRVGRFEAANGGTLFLDEVADLPVLLQVKLLRVLQEKTFERVGESQTRRSDVRIVAATNVDLRRAMLEGSFREDLYYRLRVVPIELAPLRRRREDIEPLARHLLARVSARNGRALELSPDTVRAMLDYAWPGNVRELENALEYALAVCRGQTLHREDLPPEVIGGEAPVSSTEIRPPAQNAEDRAHLVAALERNQWRRDETARSLGLSRTTLWRKMRELGLVR